ncbi:MAG TPA: PilZ domain-containing protein [Blastocatellia bacterium]
MQELDTSKISSMFLEFERLAYRVDQSGTHYQALGVEYGASMEELKQAYRNAVSLIQPIYTGEFQPAEASSQAKAARILRKTSNAFAVLSNLGKRLEYDNSLFKKRPGAIPITLPGSISRAVGESLKDTGLQLAVSSALQTGRLAPNYAGLNSPRLVAVPAMKLESLEENRRRYERFELCVPVVMAGHDRINGKWDEESETLDVSKSGARLSTNLTLRHGSVVHLSLPLPIRLRAHGFVEPIYKVYAIARRVGPSEGGPRTLGLEFLGENPPAGYLERPWAAYRTGSWDGAERRREARDERSEVVTVRYLDKTRTPFRQEIALTENISLGGAMIYVKGAPPEVEFIRLANLTRSFESVARICDRYIGSDALERISLQFLERKWPPE